MSVFDFFKDKKFNTALTDFDKLIDSMPFKNAETRNDNNSHAIGDILTALKDKGNIDSNSKKDDIDELSNIFKDLEIPQDRINRYKLYDSIYNNVQIVKRVVTVYLNNAFLSNTISNQVFNLSSKDGVDETETSLAKGFVNSFITKHKLINRLKHTTVKDMLIYGESYIEMIDLDEVKVKYPVNTRSKKEDGPIQSITENEQIQEGSNDVSSDRSDCLFLESLSKRASTIQESDIDRLIKIFVEFETEPSVSDDDCNGYTIVEESGSDANNDSNPQDRILLKFHSTSKIIPLESDYGVILGYLEVGNVTTSSSNYNPMKSFLSTVNTIGGSQKKKKTVDVSYAEFADALIRNLFRKFDIVKSKHGDSKKIEADYINAVESKVKPELMHSIKKVLVSAGKSNLSNKKLNIRFIKPNRMFAFNYPGANSVVDTLVYPGKMYLLIQLTNTISRISRSSSVRKWNLNIGARENASAVIRNLRDSLHNQRITAADMTTKDISKVMTDFKDLITVNRDGKSFVDVEMIQMGDPSIKVQDLEFQRNELVAVSGIPASYLGYNDNYELRDQLVHANISFANEIISVQNEVNDQINSLIAEAANILGHEDLQNKISFSLTPPMVLMLQVIESTMQSFGTIYSQLKDTMGIKTDPIKLLNRFIPYANWREIIEDGTSYDKKTKASKDPNDATGGY